MCKLVFKNKFQCKDEAEIERQDRRSSHRTCRNGRQETADHRAEDHSRVKEIESALNINTKRRSDMRKVLASAIEKAPCFQCSSPKKGRGSQPLVTCACGALQFNLRAYPASAISISEEDKKFYMDDRAIKDFAETLTTEKVDLVLRRVTNYSTLHAGI